MLFIVPLESLEERYTSQWSRWIPNALQKYGKDFVTIEGDTLTSKVEVGNVLDVYGTHFYKFSQLQKIVSMIRNDEIKDGDTLWFADLWFPGIEALFYIKAMTGKNISIQGVLHAGTWDKHDFTYLNGMRPWGKYIESGWLKGLDKIFVATEFHKELIIDRVSVGYNETDMFAMRKEIRDKIFVTGLFFDWQEVNRSAEGKKKKIVVFPHRLDAEKRPEMFDAIKEQLQGKYPEWSFIKTKEVCKTKEEYFRLLGESSIAVSFAQQETFGYAMLEACANGCLPVVPNDLSYATMPIYETYRFDDVAGAVDMVENLIAFADSTEYNAIAFRPSELDKYVPVRVLENMFGEPNQEDDYEDIS